MALYYSVIWGSIACGFFSLLCQPSTWKSHSSRCSFIKKKKPESRNLGKLCLFFFVDLFAWSFTSTLPINIYCYSVSERYRQCVHCKVKSHWTTVTKQVTNSKTEKNESTRTQLKCVYPQQTMQMNFFLIFFSVLFIGRSLSSVNAISFISKLLHCFFFSFFVVVILRNFSTAEYNHIG